MRLINVKTYKLEVFRDDKIPPYAILSHTWGDDSEELTLRDLSEKNFNKPGIGAIKLSGCCQQAKADDLGYAWIDTCCIDKTNAVELSEAINSMFRWYERAAICYTYLPDVPESENYRDPQSKFGTSRWFKRGWTLQELLAPSVLRFYGSKWGFLGTKGTMCTTINKITGIPRQFLLKTTELRAASVAQRMSWAAPRETGKSEDLSYCLLGIFDVMMPMVYGEGGDQAFFRLQEQIVKTTRDDSLLAWGFGGNGSPLRDFRPEDIKSGRALASAPSDFLNCGQIVQMEYYTPPEEPLDISGVSVRISLPLSTHGPSVTYALLNCGLKTNLQGPIAIPLAKSSSVFPEYIRPRGCAPLTYRLDVSLHHSTAQQIYIKRHGQVEASPNLNRQYWHCDDDALAQANLELIDVAPRTCWDEERALIVSSTESDNGNTQQILARFRHNEKGSEDFVVALESGRRNRSLQPYCWATTCPRNTALEGLARDFQNRASGSNLASNGMINLRFLVEPDEQQRLFTVRPEATLHLL